MKWLTILACLAFVLVPPPQLASASVTVTVSPNATPVTVGAQAQFSAVVTGASNGIVIWGLSGAGCSGIACGTITGTGLYTAPATVPAPNTVTVSAISLANVAVVGTATVTIQPKAGGGGGGGGPVTTITISPTSPQVALGGQIPFSATVTGTTNTLVLWSIAGPGCSGITCGTINAAGLYTAPAVAPNPPVVNVTATLLADVTKFATALVAVGSNPLVVGITISPTSVPLVAGTQKQFLAPVTGTLNTTVIWTVSGLGCAGAACGTITSGGLYTAPAIVPSPNIVTVTATAQADQTKFAQATVTLSPVVSANTSKLTSAHPYAFLFKGFDLLGAYQAAGTFVSDGNGNLTGVEDINRSTGATLNLPFTGTYQLGADNRGTMTLTSTQGVSTYAFALGPTGTRGRFVSFDNSVIRGSGILRQQDQTAFSTGALANGYAMNLTGLAADGRFGMLASIFPNGVSGVSGSAADVNDNGSARQFGTFSGSYTVATNNGRGTLTLSLIGLGTGTSHFAFYIVSAQELILISTDQFSPFNPIICGLGEQETGAPFFASSFKGFSVFNLAGFNNGQGEAYIGRMSFDGVSNVSVPFDESKNGTVTIGDGFTGSYTVALNGRGTLNLTDNNNPTPFQPTIWTFYAISPNRAFLMDSSPFVGSGEMKNQAVSPPFGDGDLVGPFAQGSGEPPSVNADLVSGVSAFDGGGTVTGTQDLSQVSALTPGQVLSGTYQVSLVAKNGRQVILLTSPKPSVIASWLVSASEFVALDVDSGLLEPAIEFFEK